MKTKVIMMLLLGAMTLPFTSCGGDGDEAAEESGRTDDNGTGIANNGGSGKELLTPKDEKTFIEETARLFESYVKASDFEDMTNVAKELDDVDDDALGDWADEAFVSTLRETKTSYYTYEYYDRIIKAANVKGTFSAKSNGKWAKTADSDDLVMSYTDKHSAEWVLTVSHSGSVKGKLYLSDDYTYSSGKRKITDTYVEVPEHVSVTLTRQGSKQVDATINVNSMSVTDGQLSVMSTVNGSATADVLDYNVATSFNYTPNANSSVSATVKKNGTMLANVSANAKLAVSNDEVTNATSVTATIDILGRLQIHLSCDDIQTISDAIDNAQSNKYDADKVDKYVANANSAIKEAYIANNGGSQQQATILFGKEVDNSNSYYTSKYGNSYQVIPLMKFSDGTTYSFEEYFTETAFQDVIDNYNSIVKSFETLFK